MAKEISRYHTDTKINKRWPQADVHYFINYGYYKPVSRGLTVACFTHYDPEHLADVFFDTANKVDHCVAISNQTRESMITLGIPPEKITTILIGAAEEFRPVVRLGICGRTYPGGRKGEQLVRKLVDDAEVMEGLEIVATSPGWAVPVTTIQDRREFYASLDYLLVPSLLEGGPVPFMEALACGVPAIAPPVGVVPEFPHIEYETGNYDSMRAVIITERNKALDAKNQLANTIQSYNWQRWAAEHIRLFNTLLGK